MMTPIVSEVAVFRKATGEFVHNTTLALAPAANDPKLAAVALPVGFDDQTCVWDATKRQFVEDAAKVEAKLLAALKPEAETRKMAALTPGGAKKVEYEDKSRDIAASANVFASVLNGLTKTAAMAQFPAAATEQALTGEPLATILQRYRAGADGSLPEVRRLSAIEQNATRLIKAAGTAAAKRAAFAAINWNWKP